MPRPVPENFDLFKEKLDPNESYIRDILRVNITCWAQFRNVISAGNFSDVLKSNTPEDVSREVKNTFIEFAKTHYEIVNSIGYAKETYNEIFGRVPTNSFFFHKQTKEFYMHIGSVLDNLGRLIYMVNDKTASEIPANGGRPLRHKFQWSFLKTKRLPVPQYDHIINAPEIMGIQNIRNNYVHNWRPFLEQLPNNGPLSWPEEIRTDQNFLWNYEETEEFKKRYTYKRPIGDFIHFDFNYIERIQNEIFAQLIKDLETFEANHNLVIM